ncbi:DUF4430 domain-containing protein [Camelliibacillus cellulosilyticus]|uniref:DUF4430 domain-containing protein n=1 Tax=Camelliibacillus cellulosilyticus TaxID=2174486 RepID=A0ABV9GKK7_9BACL
MSRVKRLGAILLVFALIAFQWAGVQHHAKAKSLDNAVTITVQGVDGKQKIMEMTAIQLNGKETVYDVLKEAAKRHGLTVKDNNGFITQIGDKKPVWDDQSHEYWGIFINGVASNVGAADSVKPGDDLNFQVINEDAPILTVHVSIHDTKGNVIDGYQNDAKVVKGSNAYDAIKTAFGDKVKASIDDQWFAFIENIDNVLKDGQYFTLNINGKAAEIGASFYRVKQGDKIVLTVPNTESGTGGTTDDGKGANGGATGTAPKIDMAKLAQATKQAANWILQHQTGHYYEAIALKQAGFKVPESFIDSYKKDLQDNNGTYRNVTDYAGKVIGITAAEKDASNFAGYPLVEKIYNNGRMLNQGLNGPIFALLAIDSGQYKVPDNAKWTREKLVNEILSKQLAGGGWTWYGNEPSPDITGMALAALAPYNHQSKVKAAVTKAANWLSKAQNSAGGYSDNNNGGDSSESTAQAIVGLTANGIDPTGEKYTKKNGNLVSHLLGFQQKDGGFSHTDEKASNAFSTPQALVAIDAYNLFKQGKGSIYQLKNDTLAVVKPSNQTPVAANTQGERLPDTATNNYNYLLAGAILIAIGTMILLIYRKRKSTQA